MKYPLIFLSLLWLLGLSIGTSIDLPIYFLYIGIILSFAFFAFSFFLFYRKDKLWFIGLLISILILGWVRMEWHLIHHQTHLPEEILNETIGIRGYLDSTPIIDGDLVKFRVKPVSYQHKGEEAAIQTKEKVMVYLFLKEEKEQKTISGWKKGMSVRFYGEAGKPFSYSNPGQFNYIEYLSHQSVYWQFRVDRISDIQTGEGYHFFTAFSDLKERLSQQINLLFKQPYAGFIKSVLLGDRQDLTKEIEEDFSISGLSHLLAISGLHLSVISLLFYGSMTRAGMTREHSVYITSVLLIVYMLLIGASASVVRATLMTLLMYYGLLFKNSFSSLQIIGLAVIIMTAYHPVWIYQIGFQLSFIVTFYILWGYPLLYEKLPMKGGGLKKALTMVLITQLASFPFVFYYFHQYSLLSWLLNLVAVPLFSAILFPFALFIYLLSFLSFPLASFLADIMSWLLTIFFNIIHQSAQYSFFHIYGNVPSFLITVMLYLLISWLLARERVKASFLIHPFKKIIFNAEKWVFMLLILMILWNGLIKDEALVTVLDVGQGDSIVIQTPGGRNLLIDSGGKPVFPKEDWQLRKDPLDIGEDIVLPYLHYRGIDQIDIAFLTHEDVDHIGGYLALVDDIKIKAFVVSEEFPRTEIGKKLESLLIEKKIKIIVMDEMKTVNVDQDTRLTVAPVNMKGSAKENDHSFVIYLKIYGTSLLFAGDVEEAGENLILENYHLPETDILKVGHHGSLTSTSDEWLNTLKPKEAVISVGESNPYHHPSSEVLNRLEENGTQIWRTDQDGAVLITIHKHHYTVNKTKNEE